MALPDFSNDAMYRELIQSVHDYAIYMLDVDGVVRNWNIGAERIKGYQAADIVGQNFECFHTEADRQDGRPQKALSIARTTGHFQDCGWRVRRDGSQFWAGVVINAIYDASGTVTGFAKVTRDLTSQKLQNDKLRQSAKELNLALSNMHQGLILFDAQEKIVLCNDRFEELLGSLGAPTSPGTSLSQLIHFHLARANLTPDEILAGVQQERHHLLSSLARSPGMFVEERNYLGRILHVSHRSMPEGGWVSTVDDITERRKMEARLIYLAQHDHLTGLPNRSEIDLAIHNEAGATERPRHCALFYIDLDGFKPINDLHGHHAGDRVLSIVAQRIRGLLCPDDVAVRLGGDEFVVFAKNFCKDNSVLTLARRIIDEITLAIHHDKQILSVSASIGIAMMPVDGCDPDTLLRKADMALYHAKREGRGQFCLYNPGLEAMAQERIKLEQDLRDALTYGTFRLHYQPIIDVRNNRPTGFEALLRWDRPNVGPVSPANFIPFAEEIGLMIEIDDWVIREACLAAKTWPSDVMVSVNLSSTQFSRPGLIERIAKILAETQLPATRLELEITETAAIHNLGVAKGYLEAIRDMGVHIALDDFGTGYSSFNLIRQLPFTRIKIDRSFIQDIAHNNHSATIVSAICLLCSGLSVRSTAEGVETAEQKRRLIAEGCTDLQGYLISKPLQADHVVPWLRSLPK